MFDRLIESDSAGAEFKPRSRYFLVSSLVVGALFISAVVISIYASDFGLGNDTFELSAMLTPVEPPADSPEPPRPQQPRTANQRTSDLQSRIIKQQPIDVTPVAVPPVSVSQNKYLSLPPGPVKIGPEDTVGLVRSSGSEPTGTGAGDSNRTASRTEFVEPTAGDPPPLVEKPRPPQSLGVINGRADSLPKPTYPAAAISMGIQGQVSVQVTIDETGKVISAKAASGNVLLRNAAESAAWKAKFTPTFLSKVPVKVTGVIVYNFTRN